MANRRSIAAARRRATGKPPTRESDPRAVERERSAKVDALAPVSPPALAGQIDLSNKGDLYEH